MKVSYLNSLIFISIFFAIDTIESAVWDRERTQTPRVYDKVGGDTTWDRSDVEAQRKEEDKIKEKFYSLIVQRLTEEKNTNLMILNDQSEIHRDFLDTFAISLIFLDGLLGQQIILCSVAILKSLQFKRNVWIDLLKLEGLEVKRKYSKFFQKINDEDMEKISSSAKKINSILQVLDPKNLDHNLLDRLENIEKDLGSRNYYLYILFFFYKTYENIFQDDSYNTFIINNDYLLFIPKEKIKKLSKDIPDNYINSFIQEKRINIFDVYAGLNLSIFDKVNNINDDPFINSYQVNHYLNLGQSLKDAIRKIFINKNDSSSENFSYLLPKFNIFLSGHGWIKDQFVGISDSYIKPILSDFNNIIKMKNLLIFSCYPAERFKDYTVFMEYEKEKVFSSFDYTIIFIGSLSSMVNFPNKYSLGKWSKYHQSLEYNILKKTFKVLDEPSIDYEKLFEEFNFNLKSMSLINHLSILFPHTHWVTASDYDKNVFNLTTIKSLISSDEEIRIPKEKEILLLNTATFLGTLDFDQKIKFDYQNLKIKFLPVYYKTNNYFISKIKFHSFDHLDLFYEIMKVDSSDFSDFSDSSDSSDSSDTDDNQFILKDALKIYVGWMISQLFSFSDITINAPISIFIDELVIQDVDGQSAIFNKIYVNIEKKEIWFNFFENGTNLTYFYNWSNNELIDHYNYIDGYNYNVRFDNFKNYLIGLYAPATQKQFFEKLKTLPKDFKQLPKKIKESHWIHDSEGRLAELKKDSFDFSKKLNSEAKSFIPQPKAAKSVIQQQLQQAIPISQKRRITHNPYAKRVS